MSSTKSLIKVFVFAFCTSIISTSLFAVDGISDAQGSNFLESGQEADFVASEEQASYGDIEKVSSNSLDPDVYDSISDDDEDDDNDF